MESGSRVRILVAGALGDLGIKISELLVERGDETFGLTRSEGRVAELESRGLRGVVGDLLDPVSTATAVASCGPEAVIQVAIGLPDRGPMRPRDLASTNRLRREGTANLLRASIQHGVRRFVSESIVAIYGYGQVDRELTEEDPVATRVPLRAVQPALDALHEQERLVLDSARANEIEGIVLRLGFYYGAGVGSTLFIAKLLGRGLMGVTSRTGAMPWVELSDAARGVVAGLDRGLSSEVYNIVGDSSAGLGELADELARQLGTPPPRNIPKWLMKLAGRYAAVMNEVDLRVSNQKAKEELGWSPRFPNVRDGVAHAVPEIRKRVLS